MRIVHVSDCYSPRSGGIEAQVQGLARAQVRAGHSVTVLTATKDLDRPPQNEGVAEPDVLRITSPVVGNFPIHPRTRAHVEPVLSRIQPDVVHVHAGGLSPFAWGGVRAALKCDVPTLITVHSVWGEIAKRSLPAAHRLVRWSQRGVRFSAVSRMAADIVAEAMQLPTDVLLTPNGIDATPWTLVIPEPHTGIRVLAVQRLATRKRTAALISAFAEAREGLDAGSRHLELVVVGEGPQRKRLEGLIRERGLAESVTLAGRKSSSDIRTLMAGSDFFVQPSVHESFGIAALEARTAGLPVIVREGTGTAEFIRSGIEGVQVRNDDCLVRAIHTLASDQDLRKMIANHNRSTPCGFDWPNVVAHVDEVYSTVLSGRSVEP